MNEKIRSFESGVLVPALEEVCRAPALLKDYAAKLVQTRPHPDPNIEELIASLGSALRKQTGTSLVLSNRVRPDGIAPIGGHYVMSVVYEEDDGRVFAAPGVIFWMRFNNKLHVFAHRYDDDVEYMPVEDVTKQHIQNHILRSFDFYKLYAFSDHPFPGHG